MAIPLTVLLIEFRSFYVPVSIVFGAILALVGSVSRSELRTTHNTVPLLEAIIGVGIVAKKRHFDA